MIIDDDYNTLQKKSMVDPPYKLSFLERRSLRAKNKEEMNKLILFL